MAYKKKKGKMLLNFVSGSHKGETCISAKVGVGRISLSWFRHNARGKYRLKDHD